jgi:hypothetical protein
MLDVDHGTTFECLIHSFFFFYLVTVFEIHKETLSVTETDVELFPFIQILNEVNLSDFHLLPVFFGINSHKFDAVTIE